MDRFYVISTTFILQSYRREPYNIPYTEVFGPSITNGPRYLFLLFFFFRMVPVRINRWARIRIVVWPVSEWEISELKSGNFDNIITDGTTKVT